MGKTKNEGNKTPTRYRPFYPTTVGPNLHDVTFQKFPSFSLRLKPNPIDKRCSPGPAAYPGDLSFIGNMKHRRIRSIYPTDKGYVYSMRIKGKDLTVPRTPGPAAYTCYSDASKGIMYSMAGKKKENYSTISPGPATYPRDGGGKDRINTILPRDLANKFSMNSRRNIKLPPKSPGPAVYPSKEKETGDKNKIATIYPEETQLLPTMKGNYSMKDRQRRPAPNAYPVIEQKHNPKIFTVDLMKKMTAGKRSPVYSMGVRHTPRQKYLVLPEDEY